MTTRLVFLPEAPGGEPWTALVGDDGRVLAHGALKDASGAGEAMILVVPGAQVLARWIDIAARTEAQARSAAAFILEDDLASARQDAHIALGAAGPGGKRLVAVVDREVMRSWLDAAAALKLKPDAVIPDHLLLTPPDDGGAVGVRIGAMMAVRAADLAATSEPDLAPILAGERAFAVIDDSDAAIGAFAAGAQAPAINLLQGAFAPRAEPSTPLSALRAPAILLAAALALPLASEGVRLARYEAASQAARAEAEDVARAALGEALGAGGDPVAAALAQAAQLRAGAAGGVAAPAAALFSAVAQAEAVEVMTLAYTPDGVLRASLSYGDYAALEAVRAHLNRLGFAAEEGGSTSADGRTIIELTVRAQA